MQHGKWCTSPALVNRIVHKPQMAVVYMNRLYAFLYTKTYNKQYELQKYAGY